MFASLLEASLLCSGCLYFGVVLASPHSCLPVDFEVKVSDLDDGQNYSSFQLVHSLVLTVNLRSDGLMHCHGNSTSQ
jgi:hypothetical protein